MSSSDAGTSQLLPPGLPGRSWRGSLVRSYVRLREHPAQLRIERWLRRLLRVGEVVASSTYGIRYCLVTRDYVQMEILRVGAYEPRTLALVRRLLEPGDTMVDVGGHVGQYALHAAQVVGPAGHVITFEPNPRTHLYLLRNLRLNESRGITPVLTAVDAERGVVRMTFGSDDNWGGARRSDEPDVPAYYVTAAPLRESLPLLGVRRVDVLKVDVEGLEERVIRSLDFNGPLRPRHIVFEFLSSHLSKQGGSATGLLETLQQQEYELTDIHGQPLEPGKEPDEYNVWARDLRVDGRRTS